MNNLNVAYHLERAPEIRKTAKDNLIKIPSKKARAKAKLKSKRMFMLSAILSFTLCAGVMCLYTSSQAVLTELTDKSEKSFKALKEAESVHTQLGVKVKNLKSVQNENSNQYIETVKVQKSDQAKIL